MSDFLCLFSVIICYFPQVFNNCFVFVRRKLYSYLALYTKDEWARFPILLAQTWARMHAHLPECRPLCSAASAWTALTEWARFWSSSICGTGEVFRQFSECFPKHARHWIHFWLHGEERFALLRANLVSEESSWSSPASSQVFRILLA